MKIHLLLAFLLAARFVATAQDGNKITIGKVDSIQSQILGEKRKLLVHLPESAKSGKEGYPVVYLLDGDAHFASVVGMIGQLSAVNGNTVVPEMIVVAIPNTDRTRDMTPTHIVHDPPMMDSSYSKNTGGGEKFLSFIEKELVPHIDSIYPTRPYKMLIGHSFGGLVVMNALITRPRLFNAYICIDPSMWYDRSRFLGTVKKSLATQKYSGISLYLGIANTMSEGMTIDEVVKDTTSDSRHIRSIIDLDKFIKSKPELGLRYKSKLYPDDSHSSAPMISEYDGLRFIFDFYQPKLTGKDFDDNTAAFSEKLTNHYANVTKQFGYSVLPSKDMINGYAYYALRQKQFVRAESLFKLNIANYPESESVYFGYGEFFVTKGDKANATIQFEKALSIEENAETREKLNALK